MYLVQDVPGSARAVVELPGPAWLGVAQSPGRPSRPTGYCVGPDGVGRCRLAALADPARNGGD
jgi:hypothetical protein